MSCQNMYMQCEILNGTVLYCYVVFEQIGRFLLRENDCPTNHRLFPARTSGKYQISWSFQTGKFSYTEHILWLAFWLDKSFSDMKWFFFYLVPLKMSGSPPWQRNNGRLLTVFAVAILREVAILCHTQQRMSILVKSQTVTDCSIAGSSQLSIWMGISLLFLPAVTKWK